MGHGTGKRQEVLASGQLELEHQPWAAGWAADPGPVQLELRRAKETRIHATEKRNPGQGE